MLQLANSSVQASDTKSKLLGRASVPMDAGTPLLFYCMILSHRIFASRNVTFSIAAWQPRRCGPFGELSRPRIGITDILRLENNSSALCHPS